MHDPNEKEDCPHCGGPDDHRGYGYNGRYYADCMDLYESKRREPTPEEMQAVAEWFAEHGRQPQ